jgi:RNA polymerase sigma-70 factor (ECF subfamily)
VSRFGANAESTSYTLIERVQRDDSSAWNTLSSLYRDYVKSLLRRLGLQECDADDVTQDVLLAVARNMVGFQPRDHKGAFRGWLKTIVRNKAMDHFRRVRKQPTIDGDENVDVANLASPVDLDDSNVDEQAAVAALYERALAIVRSEFEERTWTMFMRTVVEKLPTADVAKDMGVSSAAVRMAKVRVLRKLRETLGEPVDSE